MVLPIFWGFIIDRERPEKDAVKSSYSLYESLSDRLNSYFQHALLTFAKFKVQLHYFVKNLVVVSILLSTKII